MLRRVATFSHHSGEQLRACDSVRRRVDEPLLDSCPLIGVACAGRVRERMCIQASDSALALRQLTLCLELAVALTYHPVVFRAEAPLKPAPAHDSQCTDHQGCDYDD